MPGPARRPAGTTRRRGGAAGAGGRFTGDRVTPATGDGEEGQQNGDADWDGLHAYPRGSVAAALRCSGQGRFLSGEDPDPASGDAGRRGQWAVEGAVVDVEGVEPAEVRRRSRCLKSSSCGLRAPARDQATSASAHSRG